jgi:hypothetical protein
VGISPGRDPGARLEPLPPHRSPVWTPSRATPHPPPAAALPVGCGPPSGRRSPPASSHHPPPPPPPPPPPGRAQRGPARRGPAACVRPSAARPRLRRRAPPSAGRGRASARGRNACPGAWLRRLRGPEGGRRAGPAPPPPQQPPPPRGVEEEKEEEKEVQAGRARRSCAAPQGARVEPAGGREGVIAPPPRPSPAPHPTPPPRDSGPRTRTSEARGGRADPAATALSTHARSQAARSIKAPRPAPRHRRPGSPRAPPSSLPTLQCQLQSCGTGRGGEEAASEASPSPVRLSRAPAAAEGSSQSLCAKKG